MGLSCQLRTASQGFLRRIAADACDRAAEPRPVSSSHDSMRGSPSPRRGGHVSGLRRRFPCLADISSSETARVRRRRSNEYKRVTRDRLAATIDAMPMWRCPHCGTPQAETARCWVCRRSSTTCSTCRHFRRSVAAQIGYCGLDRRRLPLAGTELRGCWEAGIARPLDAPGAVPVEPGSFAAEEPEAPSPALRLRGFVPVELVRHRATRAARRATRASAAAEARPTPAEAPETPPAPTWSDRVTLFADADL